MFEPRASLELLSTESRFATGVDERWLNHDERPTDLLVPNADDLVVHPVSQLVNNPKNDDPRLIEPVPDQPETLELFENRDPDRRAS